MELREIILQAHMAGQKNQGHCDPSVYEAVCYYESIKTEIEADGTKPQLDDVRDILNNIPDVYKVGRNDWAFANVGIISDGYKTRQEAEIAARDAIIEAARAVARVV